MAHTHAVYLDRKRQRLSHDSVPGSSAAVVDTDAIIAFDDGGFGFDAPPPPPAPREDELCVDDELETAGVASENCISTNESAFVADDLVSDSLMAADAAAEIDEDVNSGECERDEFECIAYGGVVHMPQEHEEAVDDTDSVHGESAAALLHVIGVIQRSPTDANWGKLLRLITNEEFELPPDMSPSMYGLRRAAEQQSESGALRQQARAQLLTVSARCASHNAHAQEVDVPVRRVSDVVQTALETSLFDGSIAARPPAPQWDHAGKRIVPTSAFSPQFEETFQIFEQTTDFDASNASHVLLSFKVFADEFELYSLHTPHSVYGIYVQLLGRSSVTVKPPIYVLALVPPQVQLADVLQKYIVEQLAPYRKGVVHRTRRILTEAGPLVSSREYVVFADFSILCADYVGRVEVMQSATIRAHKNSVYDLGLSANCVSWSLQPLIDAVRVDEPPCTMRTVDGTNAAYDTLARISRLHAHSYVKQQATLSFGVSAEMVGTIVLTPPPLLKLPSFARSMYSRMPPDVMHMLDLGTFKRVVSMVICARARKFQGTQVAKLDAARELANNISAMLADLSRSPSVAWSVRLPIDFVHLVSGAQPKTVLEGGGAGVVTFSKTTADAMRFARSVFRLVSARWLQPDEARLIELEQELYKSVLMPSAATYDGRVCIASAAEALRAALVAFSALHSMRCATPNVMQLRYLAYYTYFCGPLSEYDGRGFEEKHGEPRRGRECVQRRQPEHELLAFCTALELQRTEALFAGGDGTRDLQWRTGTRFDHALATRQHKPKRQYGVPTKALNSETLPPAAKQQLLQELAAPRVSALPEFPWVAAHVQRATQRSKAIETKSVWFNRSKLTCGAFVVVAALGNNGNSATFKTAVCRLERVVDVRAVTFVVLQPYAPVPAQQPSRRRLYVPRNGERFWSALAWRHSSVDSEAHSVRSYLQLLCQVTAVPLAHDDALQRIDVVFENEWRNEQFEHAATAALLQHSTEELVARYALFQQQPASE